MAAVVSYQRLLGLDVVLTSGPVVGVVDGDRDAVAVRVVRLAALAEQRGAFAAVEATDHGLALAVFLNTGPRDTSIVQNAHVSAPDGTRTQPRALSSALVASSTALTTGCEDMFVRDGLRLFRRYAGFFCQQLVDARDACAGRVPGPFPDGWEGICAPRTRADRPPSGLFVEVEVGGEVENLQPAPHDDVVDGVDEPLPGGVVGVDGQEREELANVGRCGSGDEMASGTRCAVLAQASSAGTTAGVSAFACARYRTAGSSSSRAWMRRCFSTE